MLPGLAQPNLAVLLGLRPDLRLPALAAPAEARFLGCAQTRISIAIRQSSWASAAALVHQFAERVAEYKAEVRIIEEAELAESIAEVLRVRSGVAHTPPIPSCNTIAQAAIQRHHALRQAD